MQITKLYWVLIFIAPIIYAGKPDLFLLNTYDNRPVLGWTMSEKLDGVRGFWDGKQLLTRGGKVLNPPAWFVVHYPPFAIDGELWTQRGDFENIVSIVRTKNAHNRWRQITHHIFEVPHQAGGLLARLAVLQDYLSTHTDAPIKIIKQTPITAQHQVQVALDSIVNNGGEGIVLRNPNTPYQTGRLTSALKVKKYMDTECVVKKILAGKGKYKTKMGSLLCAMASGQLIKIGSGFTDKDRENPPNIGREITFKYYGWTQKGKPRFPVYLRSKTERQN